MRGENQVGSEESEFSHLRGCLKPAHAGHGDVEDHRARFQFLDLLRLLAPRLWAPHKSPTPAGILREVTEPFPEEPHGHRQLEMRALMEIISKLNFDPNLPREKYVAVAGNAWKELLRV